MLPAKDHLRICFAHRAYRLAERFALRNTGIAHVEVRSPEELLQHLPDADVLVVSMLWKNELAPEAGKLKFIQSISAGVDYYDKDVLRTHGIRLASAAGVNAYAVAEHAMALILALQRRLPEARDNQHQKHWRGMISEIAAREDQLDGQDPADRRHGAHRRAAGQAGQGLRHARHRHQARPEHRDGRARTPSTATTGCTSCSARRTSWPSPVR